jgi:Fe-S-cluster-containing dehydrogenase component
MTITRHTFLRLSGFTFAASAAQHLLAAVRPARWAMVVDPARCAKQPSCTKCIEACHQAHNVPAIPDPRHAVWWIAKEPYSRVFPSEREQFSALGSLPAMVLCNHCDNPPCVRVCPVQATFRREDGIVAMDWHRCIGCRYCMAACPFGARSFNWQDPRPFIQHPNFEFPTRTKGVVEKCTFCAERLGTGREPACVEACPEKALVFGNLADPASSVRALLASRPYSQRKPELGTRPRVFYLL